MEEKYDIIVVGSGVAGLFFALSTSWDKKILMITKDQMDNSDSYLAQGGICTLTLRQFYSGARNHLKLHLTYESF